MNPQPRGVTGSDQNPFAPSLDELVQEESDIREDKAADVETEELGSMAGAKL